MEKLHKVNKPTLVIDHNHWCIFLCAASSNERWIICHYRQFRSHPIYRPACNSDHGIDSILMKFVCTESLRKLQIYFRPSVELQILTCASTSCVSHKPKPLQNFIFWLFCNSGLADPIWFWNQNFEYIHNPYHQEYWENFPQEFVDFKNLRKARQGKMASNKRKASIMSSRSILHV